MPFEGFGAEASVAVPYLRVMPENIGMRLTSKQSSGHIVLSGGEYWNSRNLVI